MGLSSKTMVLGMEYYLDGGSCEIKVFDEETKTVSFYTLNNRDGHPAYGKFFRGTINFESEERPTDRELAVLLKAIEIYKRTIDFVIMDIEKNGNDKQRLPGAE